MPSSCALQSPHHSQLQSLPLFSTPALVRSPTPFVHLHRLLSSGKVVLNSYQPAVYGPEDIKKRSQIRLRIKMIESAADGTETRQSKLWSEFDTLKIMHMVLTVHWHGCAADTSSCRRLSRGSQIATSRSLFLLGRFSASECN